MSKSYDYLFKIIIIGSAAVGKSSLMVRYTDDEFSNNYVSTVGLDFKVKTLEHKGKRIKLQLWDTSGMDRFRTLSRAYYRNANGCIIGYSVEDRKSFEAVKSWMEELQTYATKQPQTVIVGNKCDLIKNVQTHELKKLAEEYKCKFFETSAKMNVGVDLVFEQLVADIMDQFCQTVKDKNIEEDKNNLRLEIEEKKKGGCCS